MILWHVSLRSKASKESTYYAVTNYATGRPRNYSFLTSGFQRLRTPRKQHFSIAKSNVTPSFHYTNTVAQRTPIVTIDCHHRYQGNYSKLECGHNTVIDKCSTGKRNLAQVSFYADQNAVAAVDSENKKNWNYFHTTIAALRCDKRFEGNYMIKEPCDSP